jgi:hypothetical protein
MHFLTFIPQLDTQVLKLVMFPGMANGNLIFFFFWVALGFELRASSLLGRRSITSTISALKLHFCLLIFSSFNLESYTQYENLSNVSFQKNIQIINFTKGIYYAKQT